MSSHGALVTPLLMAAYSFYDEQKYAQFVN
jgi:hypothetical protein